VVFGSQGERAQQLVGGRRQRRRRERHRIAPRGAVLRAGPCGGEHIAQCDERLRGERGAAAQRAAAKPRHGEPARAQGLFPRDTVGHGHAAAETLPQEPRGVVTQVRHTQVLRPRQERADQAPAGEAAALGRHHQLRRDRYADRLILKDHAARHHTQEADQLAVLVLVHQRRQLVVGPGITAEDALAVVRQLGGRRALGETEQAPAQADHVRQVVRPERPHAPDGGGGLRPRDHATWSGRTPAPAPLP